MNLLNIIHNREITGRKNRLQLEYLAEDAFVLGKAFQFDSKLPLNVTSTIAIAVSCDGKTFATTHGDHTVKIFIFNSGMQIRSFRGHPRTPWTVKYHPTNRDIVCSGCLGFEVRVWDIEKNSCVNMTKLESSIISLGFHPSGEYVAIASGAKLSVWNWSKSLGTFDGITPNTRSDDFCNAITHIRNMRAVVFHPNGRFLFVAAPDSPKPPTDAPNTHCRLFAVKFSILTENQPNITYALSSQPIILPQIHLYSDGGLDISQDGHYLITCTCLQRVLTRYNNTNSKDIVNNSLNTNSYSPMSHTERFKRDDIDHKLLPSTTPLHNPFFNNQNNNNKINAHNNNSSRPLNITTNLYGSSNNSNSILNDVHNIAVKTPTKSQKVLPLFPPFIISSPKMNSNNKNHNNNTVYNSINKSNMTGSMIQSRDRSHSSDSYINNNNGNSKNHHHNSLLSSDNTQSSFELLFTNLQKQSQQMNVSMPVSAAIQSTDDVQSKMNVDTNIHSNIVDSSDSYFNGTITSSSGYLNNASFNTVNNSNNNGSLLKFLHNRPVIYNLNTTEQFYHHNTNNNNNNFANNSTRFTPIKRMSITPYPFDYNHSYSYNISNTYLQQMRIGPMPVQLQNEHQMEQSDNNNNNNSNSNNVGMMKDELFDFTNLDRHDYINEEHLCLFKLNFESDDKILPPTIVNCKRLPGALMRAVTSTKLSSTSRYVLLGFGVRSMNVVEDHPVHNISSEIIEVATMDSRKVMTDNEDEVNVAQFHPLPGHGVIYGTKKGKIRSFVKC